MTFPVNDAVFRPVQPRLGHGVVWSDLVAEMDEEERAARAAEHPLRAAYVALAEARAKAAGPPVGERPPVALLPGESAYLLGRESVSDPVPAPPPRRGWLLRAIEGIFG